MESVDPNISDRKRCDERESTDRAHAEHTTDPPPSKLYSPAELAPAARRYAMSIVGCWADAEEVVQESFCKMLQSKNQTSTGLIERALLFRIVRNGCIDILRIKNRRQLQTLGAAANLPHRPLSNDAQLSKLESKVESSLEAMPSQWADALKLKLNGNLSYLEIANVLQATRAQVRTWIFRARKQIRLDLVEHNLIEKENK